MHGMHKENSVGVLLYSLSLSLCVCVCGSLSRSQVRGLCQSEGSKSFFFFFRFFLVCWFVGTCAVLVGLVGMVNMVIVAGASRRSDSALIGASSAGLYSYIGQNLYCTVQYSSTCAASAAAFYGLLTRQSVSGAVMLDQLLLT
jgi:hypothetical protein